MPTRLQVLKTLADEITAFAQRFERKDPKAGDDLETYIAETLMDRLGGDWASFENLIFDVQGTLDPTNAGCDGYDDKFTKHIVKYAGKMRDKAAGKKTIERPKKT